MPTYDRATTKLFKEFAATLRPRQLFSRGDAQKWFRRHYPRTSAGTVTVTLGAMTTNSDSRHNHPSVRPGSGHDLFYRPQYAQYRLWNPKTDEAPKHPNAPGSRRPERSPRTKSQDRQTKRRGGQLSAANRLTLGAIYTREDLRGLFGIRDATLNNGVFPFPARNEIWLFVTEAKTADRTQYRDQLSGDTLSWQGQTAGRTDRLVIDHVRNGQRLLVFYRRQKYEFAGAGFRFEGEVAYRRHRGSHPTNFTLSRVGPGRALPDDQGDDKPFDPKSTKDGREKILRSIRVRRGQQRFRSLLLQAYEWKCAFTGCRVLGVLEAAHISPYRGQETNRVTNGLLLRADLHTLFDSGLITVHPVKRTIALDRTLMRSEYRTLHGKKIRRARGPKQQPSTAALQEHRDKGILEIN